MSRKHPIVAVTGSSGAGTSAVRATFEAMFEAEAVNAEIVLTECNSCVHNLTNAKLRKQKFKIYNLSQFLGELLKDA